MERKMINVRHVRAVNLLSPTKIGGDFAINPYVGCPHKCIYCYAACINWSGAERDEAWGDYLDVKDQAHPIDPAKIFRKRILFSSMTDAYNPYEEKAEVTRGILKQLIPAEVKITVITKSALVVRDIDLFKRFPYVKVIFSFSSLDDGFRRKVEPYAASPERKIAALMKLKGAGIATGVFVAPTFPVISDPVAITHAVAPYVCRMTYDSLNLRRKNRDAVLGFIRREYPQLTKLYDDIFLRGDKRYWIGLRKEIRAVCLEERVNCGVFF